MTGTVQATKSIALLCAAAAIACGGDACGGGNSGQARSPAEADGKKVFTFFRQSAHKSLDPVEQLDQASAELITNVYDTLVSYHYLERPYELQPNLLARMPELSADGLTYTFELREGVRFHDDPAFPGGKGRELVTDDVIYSLKRYADANLNAQSYMLLQGVIEGMDEFRKQTEQLGKGADYGKLQIAGVQKLDDRRFTIKLTQPNPRALYPLAVSSLSIVPREAVEHYKDDFRNHPVGTGPFRIKELSRRGVTVLEKNPNYHLTYPAEGAQGDAERGLLAAAGKRLPFVDEVHLPLIEESQPAMLKFLTGQLDWIGIDRDNFAKMAYRDDSGFHLTPKYADKFKIYDEPSLSTEFLVFNMKDPVVGKNKALRQAIALAIDRKGFIEQMRNNRGVAPQTILPVALAGSESDVDSTWYENDLEQAKAKLAEAGYPGGKGLPPITIEYRASTTQTRQDYEFLRAQLAKVGIQLQANFQTFTAFMQRIDASNFQIASAGWGADYPDGENFYQLLYGANQAPGPNSGSYANPEYDRLFQQIQNMPNGPERFALFERMNAIVREDVPVIVTWNPTVVGLHHNWVRNFKRNMMIDAPYMYVDVDPALQAKGVR